MTIGDESCDQIDQEVDGTAMARMLDLAAIFELIRDGLDDGAFAQEELVRPLEQAVVHLLTQLGDEVQPVGDQQLLGQRLGEIAFIPKELAHETSGQLGNRVPIIDVARGEAKGQQVALIIDDQVQLETEEPADGGLATSSAGSLDPMLVDASVMTDGKGCGDRPPVAPAVSASTDAKR
jgi:hypothetical protein